MSGFSHHVKTAGKVVFPFVPTFIAPCLAWTAYELQRDDPEKEEMLKRRASGHLHKIREARKESIQAWREAAAPGHPMTCTPEGFLNQQHSQKKRYDGMSRTVSNSFKGSPDFQRTRSGRMVPVQSADKVGGVVNQVEAVQSASS